MLEQQVDEHLATVAPRRRVQQIGVLVPQGIIDEAARAKRECLPVERLGQHRRYDGAQHATGVLGLAEHGFEQPIVRIGNHQRYQHRSSAHRRQALERQNYLEISLERCCEHG